MDIILMGYGRMGREIESIALNRGHRISARFDENQPASGELMKGDVAIDFSTADALFFNLSLAFDNQLPIVVGTTGWNDKLAAVRALVEQTRSSLIYSSNFSIGMQMFQRIVQRAAELANRVDEYDMMLQEIHHKRKVDSPSGSALTLADVVLKAVERKTSIQTETMHGRIDAAQLHVTSTRVGEVAGTHTMLLDSTADAIELTHRAKNRSGFALGAVLAAEWIVKHPGFHDFSQVFDELLQDVQA